MAHGAEDIADDAPPVTGNRKPRGDGRLTAALPYFFPTHSTDGIPRISQQTFIRFLDGEFDYEVDEKMIIDCRFDYEYKGGHVQGAVGIDSATNVHSDSLVIDWLFSRPTSNHIVIILYCEFSLLRAPTTAASIRSRDRERNVYPRLTYPDMYVLEGGYSSFFHRHSDRCVPQAYIHMSDAAHSERGRLRIDQLRRGAQHRKQSGYHRTRSGITKSYSYPNTGGIKGKLLFDITTDMKEGF